MPTELKPDGQVLLKCVNHDAMIAHAATGQPTTMQRTASWFAITGVEPPGSGVNNLPRFNPGSGIPVRLYICSVCGYVELYAGAVAEPLVWTGPNA